MKVSVSQLESASLTLGRQMYIAERAKDKETLGDLEEIRGALKMLINRLEQIEREEAHAAAREQGIAVMTAEEIVQEHAKKKVAN